MSGNPLDGIVDEILSRPQVPTLSQRDLIEIDGEARMQDLRIAEVLGFDRPRKIRELIQRNISRLEVHGSVCPTVGQTKGEVFATVAKTTPKGGRPGRTFYLNEAQAYRLCMWSDAPNANAVQEQMIEVFLAWRHGKLAQQKSTLDEMPGAIVYDFDQNAMSLLGGLVKGIVRKRDAELLEEINRSFQSRVFGYIEQSLPLIDDYITGLVEDALDKFVSRQPGLDPIVRAVEQRLAARAAQDEEPLVLAPMATYRGQRSQAVELPALPRTDLRTWRIAKGWTLRQVAEKIGTSPSRVCKHEQGHCIPSPQFVLRYRKLSGGKLTADVFTENYERRKIQEGRWSQAPARSAAKLKITTH